MPCYSQHKTRIWYILQIKLILIFDQWNLYKLSSLFVLNYYACIYMGFRPSPASYHCYFTQFFKAVICVLWNRVIMTQINSYWVVLLILNLFNSLSSLLSLEISLCRVNTTKGIISTNYRWHSSKRLRGRIAQRRLQGI